jgi:hypothetical protein
MTVEHVFVHEAGHAIAAIHDGIEFRAVAFCGEATTSSFQGGLAPLRECTPTPSSRCGSSWAGSLSGSQCSGAPSRVGSTKTSARGARS